MRVAVVSNRNVPGYPAANAADHVKWIRKAAEAEARLVLFPELSLSGYSTADFMSRIATALDGRWPSAVARAARKAGIHVAFGLPLRSGRKLHISHAIAGPRGFIGHYEKVHLAGGEGRTFAPGQAFRVFDVEGVRVGINICADGRHPGSSLCLAHLGAEVILHPHGNIIGRLGVNPRDWTNKKRAYLGARAVDTCTYSMICNSVGTVRDRGGRTVHFSGGALVLGPGGRFVARSQSTVRRPHMIVADLDIERLRKLRPLSPFARRRPEVYLKALSRR
jgi:N-carbamoylputrescine amidase